MLVLAVALGITVRREGWVPAAALPIGIIALTYLYLWAVWIGDAVELARHGLAASMQLLLGLRLLSIVLFDAHAPSASSAAQAGS